jgi:outer membrane protein assembly factor BamD
MKKFFWVLPLCSFLMSCGGKNVATNPPGTLDEPDRALFERSMRDLNKNKFTVARLTLQTLINTYPDSEYLPQAKYALAESFFRESSSSSLSQAENEFKDYITFFPVSELADDAQLKVAMTHIRRMEKADRDSTQARIAEIELKQMIDAYPDSTLLEEAKDKLRAVQEVLADGVVGVANQYLLRKNYAAAMSRYKEVMTKYPDYSGMPEALYNMGEALRHIGNEEESSIYYARVVMEHPMSSRVDDSKRRLTAVDKPIPEPNPVALLRAQQTPHEDRSILGKMLGMFKPRPSVPTETGAASTAEVEEGVVETAPAPVRGGVTGSTGTNAGSTGNGEFSIEPRVDTKAPQQPAAPKPR